MYELLIVLLAAMAAVSSALAYHCYRQASICLTDIGLLEASIAALADELEGAEELSAGWQQEMLSLDEQLERLSEDNRKLKASLVDCDDEYLRVQGELVREKGRHLTCLPRLSDMLEGGFK